VLFAHAGTAASATATAIPNRMAFIMTSSLQGDASVQCASTIEAPCIPRASTPLEPRERRGGS
jgi:hypothetical protein